MGQVNAGHGVPSAVCNVPQPGGGGSAPGSGLAVLQAVRSEEELAAGDEPVTAALKHAIAAGQVPGQLVSAALTLTPASASPAIPAFGLSRPSMLLSPTPPGRQATPAHLY